MKNEGTQMSHHVCLMFKISTIIPLTRFFPPEIVFVSGRAVCGHVLKEALRDMRERRQKFHLRT